MLTFEPSSLRPDFSVFVNGTICQHHAYGPRADNAKRQQSIITAAVGKREADLL